MEQATNRPEEITRDTVFMVSIDDDGVSIYQQRKLAHLCVRCGEDALPDADYCAPHLVAKRQSDKQWRKSQRRAARKRRKCADCPRASKTFRCATCSAKRRRKGVDRPARGVDKEEIWRVDPGTTWSRYRGKARRGRLTRSEQRAEDKRDARWAIREIEKFIANVDALESADDLPPIQRAAKKREAAAPLGFARRIIEGLEERHE